MQKYKFLTPAALFWIVGFGFFYMINQQQADLKSDLEAIERGESTPLTLTLAKKWVQPGSGSGSNKGTDSHWIAFDKGGDQSDRHLSYEEYQMFYVGQQFAAHNVNGEIVIEELDTLQPRAKWVMLGFCMFLGCIPLAITGYNVLTASD